MYTSKGIYGRDHGIQGTSDANLTSSLLYAFILLF
jgi:hypothetical protein